MESGVEREPFLRAEGIGPCRAGGDEEQVPAPGGNHAGDHDELVPAQQVVSELLLAGTRPERILCLTYTKAAATEMQNRLLARLGQWAMLPEPGLRAELAPQPRQASLF